MAINVNCCLFFLLNFYIICVHGMVNSTYTLLFELLRFSLGYGKREGERVPLRLSQSEWQDVYNEAKRQSVLDVAYVAISKLSKEELPPKPVLMRWAAHAETTRAMNKNMNEYAVRLTEIFSKAGCRTAVLKGAANARLYPDPFSRQCGDVDLWVEGGRESVEKLLLDLKLITTPEDTSLQHHFHLPKNENGIVAEIHFRPTAGNLFKEREFQAFMSEELLKSQLVPEGFYAPSIKFALVMQLFHLQHHFYSGGLGLRQYMDYFVLLQNSSEAERKEALAVIDSLYMHKVCSAVMWLLGEVFRLDRHLMLCSPDAWRGKWLLDDAAHGGNFGKHTAKQKMRPPKTKRWLRDRLRVIRLFPFDPVNVIFKEWKYWRLTLPLRIKRRRISL